jgi:glutamate-1-semialdehyde aminotransferase
MTKKFKTSNLLYERSLKSVPLASQTFSKSALNYPLGASPLFFDKGEGAYVWDYDGNKFIDYVLGLMPIILGYKDPEVDLAIKNQLNKGIIFSLPTELEVELSELLISLIPSAEMVRFGKNGSDVTSAAIRLARAYTNRNRIAICGYHGWHDWYIGTTVRNLGVPKTVSNLTSKFNFNDTESLESLLKADPNGYAAVIMEPTGAFEPKQSFLQEVKELCVKYGVVLVFDEIVSGFRVNLGGAQKKYAVTPDLSTFGKAMGNGMPISAIVGSRQIMKLMDDIFFSSTFGGEALSLAASIATIKKLEKLNAPSVFKSTGEDIYINVQKLINQTGLNEVVNITGVDWWPRFEINSFKGTTNNEISTLLRQELIENGIFIGGGFNMSLSHDSDVMTETYSAIRRAFESLAEYLNMPNPTINLRGKLIKPVFQVRKL